MFFVLFSRLFFLGRTALHWAAAVNNKSAVIILLKNNANKYVQDDKVNLSILSSCFVSHMQTCTDKEEN